MKVGWFGICERYISDMKHRKRVNSEMSIFIACTQHPRHHLLHHHQEALQL